MNLLIPKASWEPIYFQSIDSFARTAGWQRLRQMEVPKGDLEIRAWIGFGLSPLRSYRIWRTDGKWFGLHGRAGFGEEATITTTVTPSMGWTALWTRIEGLGILALPDASTLPHAFICLDGVSYVVEFNDGANYRTYMYGNPQVESWPEANKIIEIANVLSHELSAGYF